MAEGRRSLAGEAWQRVRISACDGRKIRAGADSRRRRWWSPRPHLSGEAVDLGAVAHGGHGRRLARASACRSPARSTFRHGRRYGAEQPTLPTAWWSHVMGLVENQPAERRAHRALLGESSFVLILQDIAARSERNRASILPNSSVLSTKKRRSGANRDRVRGLRHADERWWRLSAATDLSAPSPPAA